MTLPNNEIIDDRFELLERAGSGGMGLVYRALDRRTGQPVALKILHYHNDSPGRFLREARLLSELRHPGIVGYLDQGVLRSGEPFLVMEWLQGEDLARRLLRGALLPAEALDLVARVADALSVAHQRGIVHRDIKPSNLFLRHGELVAVVVVSRCNSAPIVSCASRRASAAPRQKWMPWPNARCRLSRRSGRKQSASGN